MNEKEFIFCDTPTMFITRVDHFLHCPLWFDELDEESKGSFYQNIGLELENRAPRLKVFHTTQALLVENWKSIAMHLIVSHLVSTYPNSKFYIIDGHPKEIMSAVYKKVVSEVQRIIPGYGNDNLCIHCSDITMYRNAVLSIQGIAKNFEKVAYDIAPRLVSDFIPELNNYNEAIMRMQEEQKQQQIRAAQPSQVMAPFLIKPEGGDNGGGTILQ